jgi:O-antigen/teichoic acid export membrane protein
LRGAILGSVSALAIQWALNHCALRRECTKANISYQFAGSHRELGMLYRFSLPAFLASILVVAAIWVCNALLARQPQGYAELGLYAAADKWRVLIVFLPTYVFAMIVPVLSNLHGEGDGAGFQKVFKANLRVNASLALVLAVLIAVFAGPIMAMYGSSFGGGRIVLMVLACSACAEVLNAILGQPLIASHQMWRRFGFDLLLVAVLVGLAWVLIPKWGARGLAASYGVAYATASLALFLFHQQGLRNSSPSY